MAASPGVFVCILYRVPRCAWGSWVYGRRVFNKNRARRWKSTLPCVDTCPLPHVLGLFSAPEFTWHGNLKCLLPLPDKCGVQQIFLPCVLPPSLCRRSPRTRWFYLTIKAGKSVYKKSGKPEGSPLLVSHRRFELRTHCLKGNCSAD